MFDSLSILFHSFVYLWIAVIAVVPAIFMGGLKLCVIAMGMTYFDHTETSQKS